MAHTLDSYIKSTLNERYNIVIKSLEDNKKAIEQMTQELLEVEVISGERVREIIKENGGEVYEDEDLHTEALNTDEEASTNQEENTTNNSNDKE